MHAPKKLSINLCTEQGSNVLYCVYGHRQLLILKFLLYKPFAKNVQKCLCAWWVYTRPSGGNIPPYSGGLWASIGNSWSFYTLPLIHLIVKLHRKWKWYDYRLGQSLYILTYFDRVKDFSLYILTRLKTNKLLQKQTAKRLMLFGRNRSHSLTGPVPSQFQDSCFGFACRPKARTIKFIGIIFCRYLFPNFACSSTALNSFKK